MSKRTTLQNLCVVLFFLFSTSVSLASGRTDRRLGVYAAFGDPTGSLIGGNVAFNVFNFLKVNAGYGVTTFDAATLSSYGVSIPSSLSVFGSSVSISARNVGFGAQLLFPGWLFSPSVGVKYISTTVVGSVIGISLPLLSATTFVAQFGLDWQSSFGLQLAGGWQIPFSSTLPILVGVGSPYVSVGWFFSL